MSHVPVIIFILFLSFILYGTFLQIESISSLQRVKKDLSYPCLVYALERDTVNIHFKGEISCFGSLHNEIETMLKGSVSFGCVLSFRKAMMKSMFIA